MLIYEGLALHRHLLLLDRLALRLHRFYQSRLIRRVDHLRVWIRLLVTLLIFFRHSHRDLMILFEECLTAHVIDLKCLCLAVRLLYL